MGIFSLFGKKEKAPAGRKPGGASSRSKGRQATPRDDSERIPPRKPSRVTADKIDAIESEMSSEFVQPLPFSGNTLPFPADDPFPLTTPPSSLQPLTVPAPNASLTQQTLPHAGSTTSLLLHAETRPGPVALSEAAPVIEEAAILFANGQTNTIEPILRHAIDNDAAGSMPLSVWGMLFDLYQITDQREQFENLAVDYASRFERSPPAWRDPGHDDRTRPAASRGGATPGVAFGGTLDSGIVKQLERLRNLSDMSETLRLDFTRVSAVDPVGCGLLLNILKRLQRSGHHLMLAGAVELTAKIRAILAVGRRDETEAPWLLLLELLRLLNRETEFEEASIDYCITFEVSPPAFVAPHDTVVAGTEEAADTPDDEAAVRFAMPAVVSAGNDTLLTQVVAFVEAHQPAVLDCTHLVRMDFSAASQLFSGLMPLINSGRTIELYNANHFIAALCHVMGFQDLVRILPRNT
ncbi:hypothetical protein GCM10007205_14700 [Oxalicibacterium flavum]|uniref:STAS domain-containing protein n=1 Tax=Oxalicibacterium flavum TaxID=179467 RepID=A0A8J2UMC6_9BURK|nr:hypothetical protein [Oxalicibacterium flavum]GGC06570.1 hypothetical protein GCM10007205_14700 [Oxalicibacterium flavum]